MEEIYYLVDTNNWIAHVLAETDQNNTLLAYYTRGNDSLITQERFGTKSYYLYDGHGSVRMLASSAGAITDTYDYDAYGVMLASTGTTENSYLYAGEQFDAGTELYYLRARYMEPSTGVFITMDTYQGNIHDPVSLHKYMYANANPVQFTDPTGYIAIWDTPVGLGIQKILQSRVGLNVIRIYKELRIVLAVVRIMQARMDFAVATYLGDVPGMLLAMANGIIGSAELITVCTTGPLCQILVKALAVIDIGDRLGNTYEAIQEGDIKSVFRNTVFIVMDIVTIASSCFDGDTLVATEGGYTRIDEIKEGDKVWAYNVETGELELKEVLKVYVKKNDEILHLEVEFDGGGGYGFDDADRELETIDTTTNHPFYIPDKGWVAAGDLTIGDEVFTLNGKHAVITGMELEKLDEAILVYNIEAEDFHTYFVGDGEASVLVHNSCRPEAKLEGAASMVLNGLKVQQEQIPLENQKDNGHPLIWIMQLK